MVRKLFMSIVLALLAISVPAQEDSLQIQEVVVTGSRNAVDAKLIPNTVTKIEHDKLAGSYDFSILPSVMEQTPGLFSTSRSVLGYGISTGAAGNIKIRGLGGMAELLVLIDGQPQFAGLMAHPVPDVYQTMAAEKVEILRGPSSLYYGSNAMGGVINIVTRNMQNDGCRTDIDIQGGSFGTFQAQASNRLRHGAFSSIAGVQYQRTDGHRDNSEFDQIAGFVKLEYDLSEYWNMGGDVNITHFNSSNPGPEQAPLYDNDSKITRGLASLQIKNDYGWTNGALRIFYDWGHHNIDDGTTDITEVPTDKLYKHDDYITGFNLFQSAALFDGNRTTIGFEYQNYGGSAWNEDKQTGGRTYIVKDDDGNIVESKCINDVAAYIDFRQSVSAWLTLDAGIRMDHHSVIGTEWVPQAGVAFHITTTDNIKVLVSKGFRNPSIRDMYMFPPSSTDLEPERVMSYELAYDGNNGNGLSYGLNLFFMNGENLINTIRIDGRPRNVNTGTFRHWGIEANMGYIINGHWNIDANYSWLRMQTPIEGSPEHKAFAGITYRYGKFSVHPTLQYIGKLYLTSGENGGTESYTLLNLSASYQICKLAQLFAKGENLLCQHYQTYQGFYMPKATVIGGIRLSF